MITSALSLARPMLYGEPMPLLLPVVMCVVGIGVSLLPPAEVWPVEREGERSGSWLPMIVAMVLVVSVCGVAVHRLVQDEPRQHEAVAGR